MKKIILRLTLICALIGASLSSTVSAQHIRPHRHHYGSGDGFYRAMRTAESIGQAAMFGSFLHHLDDYTGIRLGYNAASLRTDLEYANVNSDFTSGLNVGIVFGWQLGKSPFIIEPGIYYSMKGGKLNGKYDKVTSINDLNHFTTSITMHNIEIPLVFKCQLPLSPKDGVILQPFVGGFLSFGFAGTTKYKDAIYRESYDTYDEGLFCTTDAGLRMGTGVTMGNLYFEVAYDLGLVNLPEHDYELMGFDDFSDSMRSNTLSFSVGFNF